MAGDAAATRIGDGPLTGPLAMLVANGGRSAMRTIVLPVLVVAAVAWALTARMGWGDMSMGATAFVTGWLVMMVAMMLPAAAPVVGIYALAARRGVVAAVAGFVAGYLVVWGVAAVPPDAVSRALGGSLLAGPPRGRGP